MNEELGAFQEIRRRLQLRPEDKDRILRTAEMTRDEKIHWVTETILGFDWCNYGLDEVSLAQSDEWAVALATKIVNRWFLDD